MTRRVRTALRSRGSIRTIFVAAAVLAQVGIGLALVGWPDRDSDPPTRVAIVPDRLKTTVPPSTSTTEPSTTTTSPSTTSTTAAPATTTTVTLPPTTVTTLARGAPTPKAATLPAPPSGGISAYVGAGTWIDVFDFNPAHTNGSPTVTPADVDRMADAGIQTIYLQAARPEDPKAPDDLTSPDLLAQFLVRAHARGIEVVAWYLPHLTDVSDDMRHLQAMLGYSVEGHQFDSVALDIEWRAGVPDHATRSERLVDLSRRLRDAAGAERSLGAIVMPPVVTDVINPNFWPGYPWESLAPLYNVWLPMAYWTNRSADSPYRDAYRYTADNVNLLRQHVGAGAPVHVIGGIGNAAGGEDYQRFMQASAETGSIGWSIYDWATTDSGAWPILRG